jgi:regulator of sigma E protease
MPYFLSTLTFFLLLGVVVVVHELGHLIIARMNGVFCEAFSFGFGNVLFKKKDRKGTEWRISLYPLGGYVKMLGDADVSSVREVMPEGYTEEDMERMSVHHKKPWQKLLIAAGGPFANFVFAILVLFTLSTINGVPEYDNTITVMSEQNLAYKSGLRTGDVITKANDTEVNNFIDIAKQVKISAGKDLKLELKRDGETKELNIEMFEQKDDGIKPIQSLGISPKGFKYKKVSILQSAKLAILTTWHLAYSNIEAVCKIATGAMSTKNVGGIISIFKVSSDSAEAGIVSFITMIAMISIILGAINLLPIPVLDGGSIAIAAIEWVIGKPLNKKFVNVIFTVGLVAVVGLMLLGMWNDLVSIKFFSWMESLIK